uniref:Uncharacterized protein n=1 Tax=Anguilla anguilla TaxID=7936 RepID=A0A0E9RZX8_ANGAN
MLERCPIGGSSESGQRGMECSLGQDVVSVPRG